MIGTALLLIAINWSSGNARAIALTIFGNLMIFGGDTGGHFNPAVTTAVLVS